MNVPDVFLAIKASLHWCFTFNKREKIYQLGDMILMFVNFDYVVSQYLNGVECISENFLCTNNVEIIRNVLFKL